MLWIFQVEKTQNLCFTVAWVGILTYKDLDSLWFTYQNGFAFVFLNISNLDANFLNEFDHLYLLDMVVSLGAKRHKSWLEQLDECQGKIYVEYKQFDVKPPNLAA